ncbi:MAG: hypothetical protein KAR19_05320 [Bacteroidales bacterium]|nr:hypothetical protein [Bacteroidales bacterium]
MKTEPGRYNQPQLQEHVEYLYKMVTDTRQKTGRDAFDRFKILQEAWSSYNDLHLQNSGR